MEPAATPTPEADADAADTVNVAFWGRHIEDYERATQEWSKRGKQIVKRYRDERSGATDGKRIKYNVLWANVETLKPALYARNPKPDIARRFKDADPIGRVAADVLERSVSYFVANDKFGQTMRQAVLDYLLPGRGTVWARYVPHMRDEALQVGGAEVAEEGTQVTDDAAEQKPSTVEVVDYEEALVDYVHADDFGHTVARTWDEVRANWRKVYLGRAELVRRFGQIGASVPLDHCAKDAKGRDTEGEAKATVYELWDIQTKKAFWLHKSVERFLDERPDPLGLDGFWPTPRPLFANLANDSLIPVPDYVQYQDQATELDNLTARIEKLTKALKAAGVYDKSAEGIQRLYNEGVENELIPVDQWSVFAERGGIKGAVDFLPIRDVVEVLVRLYEARAQVKQDLYEISGMADIIRGASNPNETATAQQLKSNFATLRLADRQAEVQRFARDLVKILTQIIANHFQLDTIKLISGVRLFTAAEKQMVGQALASQPQAAPQVAAQLGVDAGQLEDMLANPTWEEVEKLIRDRVARCFRIDIETDSTIKQDEEQEKASRVEFLTAAGGFLQQAVVAGQQAPELVPLLGRMLMFGLRAFHVGKDLETAFQSALTKLDKAAAQPQQPGPDPEAAKMQFELQREQIRQAEETKRFQIKQQAENQRLMHAETTRGQVEIERERIRSEAQRETATIDAETRARAAVDVAATKGQADVTKAVIAAEATARQPRQAAE
jgi:hypothetical protein